MASFMYVIGACGALVRAPSPTWDCAWGRNKFYDYIKQAYLPVEFRCGAALLSAPWRNEVAIYFNFVVCLNFEIIVAHFIKLVKWFT